jgi:hypothetical protein
MKAPKSGFPRAWESGLRGRSMKVPGLVGQSQWNSVRGPESVGSTARGGIRCMQRGCSSRTMIRFRVVRFSRMREHRENPSPPLRNLRNLRMDSLRIQWIQCWFFTGQPQGSRIPAGGTRSPDPRTGIRPRIDCRTPLQWRPLPGSFPSPIRLPHSPDDNTCLSAPFLGPILK